MNYDSRLTMTVTINFVTGNPYKLASFKQHVLPFGYHVVQKQLDLIEPQADSVEGVVMFKARQAYQRLKTPVVVEDTGFYIDELSGFPGPYTRYMLDTVGVGGLLNLATSLKSRTARFLSVLVYVDENGASHQFTDGEGWGTIATSIDEAVCREAWSDLWRIFVPCGASASLCGMSVEERSEVLNKWQTHSVYTQFAKWLNQSD